MEPVLAIPGQPTECQDQGNYFADLIEGIRNRQWWVWYDSEQFKQATASTRELTFFINPQGAAKTIVRTNMQRAGTIPSPQSFICWFAGLYLIPIPESPTTEADLMLLANNMSVQFFINDKPVFQTLAWDLPAGGGQRVTQQAAGTSDYVWNGQPDQRALKYFRVPKIIMANEQFKWTVEIDDDAWAGLTDSAVCWCYLTMHGELYRKVN